jgi:hypothetical protein
MSGDFNEEVLIATQPNLYMDQRSTFPMNPFLPRSKHDKFKVWNLFGLRILNDLLIGWKSQGLDLGEYPNQTVRIKLCNIVFSRGFETMNIIVSSILRFPP